MSVFKFTQTIVKIFPPLMACYLRELVYPYKRAKGDDVFYSRRSITGSLFTGSTKEFHSYWFGIHGFFDWRNIVIAKTVHNFNPNSEIIEVGANIGTETIGFADIVGKNGTVHAFEPLPVNQEEILKIKANNLHLNINFYPVGLSDRNATVDFLVPPVNYSGIGRVVDNDSNSEAEIIKINLHKLDDYHSHFKNISAIFIDVEGHELYVLNGAKETIIKHKPIVVLEVSDSLLAENSLSSLDIFDFFKKHNYLCFNIGRFLLKRVTEKNINNFRNHSNWVCLPASVPDLIFHIKKKLYKHIFIPLNKI